jgi:phytoene desaturase
LGINQTIPNLKHHTLFFENDLDEHIDCIYGEKKWPENPLFYACCPSKTDKIVAPKGKENLFLLMPLAIGINDDEKIGKNIWQKCFPELKNIRALQTWLQKLSIKEVIA